MTDSPAAPAAHCDDPHDHTGHDHPPTGADLVPDMVKGLSIQALLIPALGILLLVAILPFAPVSPAPLLLGFALGALQLISLVATSLFVARTRKQLAINPGLLAVRSVVDELLRVATVLLAILLWPGDIRTELGIWIGAGCALVWLVLATAQTITTPGSGSPAPVTGRRLRSPPCWRSGSEPAPRWSCGCWTCSAPCFSRSPRPCW